MLDSRSSSRQGSLLPLGGVAVVNPNLAASAFGGAAGTLGGLAGPAGTVAAGAVVTAGVRSYVNDALPTYHAGDVIVSIQAQVNGGIGPQRSSESLIIKT